MRSYAFPFSLFGGSMAWLLICSTTIAQIIPDNTLPNNSVVPLNCSDCEITGGTRSGDNLFHSFEQFSIPTNGTAFFNNAVEIRNIFARITGRSLSEIDGLIRANGSASLFLLNPNGIIFGANASLDIGGSFIASTADSILFADSTEFSAIDPLTTPLLTVSVPVGLQFGQDPGFIINRSQAVNTFGTPVGLEVQADQTLALIGNGVFLDNGNLTARGGRIELGSISATDLVTLSPINSGNSGFAVTYSGVENFADIQLSDRSAIETSGGSLDAPGGTIQLQGRNIVLLGDSSIFSSTFGGTGGTLRLQATESIQLNDSSAGTLARGNGQAGDVRINANDSLELVGGDSLNSLGSQALNNSTGDAGNIFINAGQLSIQDGFRIEASTFGTGNGGNIQIRASEVEVIGTNPQPIREANRIFRRGELTSGIVSQVAEGAGINSGDAGSLTIDTQRLVILDGGVVSTATFAGGDGGTLTINASESIFLSGASPLISRDQFRSGIFVSAEPDATGTVGELTITTDQLTLDDRAEISANNRGSGQPGLATLNVDALLVQGGSEIRASSLGVGDGGTLIVNADSILITGTGDIRGETIPSALSALARSSGDAGNLQITASTVEVRDGAEVSVSGRESGAAGNLFITADTLRLDRGRLTASTNAGEGAEITIQNLTLLEMRDRSQITAEADNAANGGNITINAPDGFVVAFPNQDNDIIANAFEGRGGDIRITANSIIGLQEQRAILNNGTNDIDASSELGTSGTVTLNRPDVDPSQGLVELPTDVTDASSLIAQACPSGVMAEQELSEFVITGRGGLPPNPSDTDSINPVATDWVTLESSEEQSIGEERAEDAEDNEIAFPSDLTDREIIEAQGWMIDENGQVILLAQAPVAIPQIVALIPPDCTVEWSR